MITRRHIPGIALSTIHLVICTYFGTIFFTSTSGERVNLFWLFLVIDPWIIPFAGSIDATEMNWILVSLLGSLFWLIAGLLLGRLIPKKRK